LLQGLAAALDVANHALRHVQGILDGGVGQQGHEFIATVKDALHVAQRMVRHVERSRQTLQQQTLSLSFGVVQVQPDEKLTDAIRRALLALDEARSQGDSRFVSAEDEDGMPVFAPSQTLGHSNF
jgi:GGDEF domain-containing protein